jgi:hypothetical protein
MTIQEFVSDSLSQIAKGVADARGNKVTIPTDVYPLPGDKSSHGGIVVSGTRNATVISFDIAVTVKETEGGGKAAISVAQIFSIEGGGDHVTESSTVSRIQFKIPVSY